MADIEALGKVIVHTAFRIHVTLGPGLRENVYERVFARDLTRADLLVERQKPVSFEYEGMHFENGGRHDLLIERLVAVELKSAERLHPEYYKQLLTNMRLDRIKLGFLINFGEPRIRIRRVVNGL
jgi:iron complex transport system substrate-binding protein